MRGAHRHFGLNVHSCSAEHGNTGAQEELGSETRPTAPATSRGDRPTHRRVIVRMHMTRAVRAGGQCLGYAWVVLVGGRHALCVGTWCVVMVEQVLEAQVVGGGRKSGEAG